MTIGSIQYKATKTSQSHGRPQGERGGGVTRVGTRPPWKITPIFSPIWGAFLLLFSLYGRPFSPCGGGGLFCPYGGAFFGLAPPPYENFGGCPCTIVHSMLSVICLYTY